jgi:hypothetical protein
MPLRDLLDEVEEFSRRIFQALMKGGTSSQERTQIIKLARYSGLFC